MNNERNVTIDIAKGIGIFLVVLGHFMYLENEYIRDFIYSFHVELFFFISGFLYKKADMKATVSKVVKKFVIPAYIIGIIDVIMCLINSEN